MSSVLCVSFRIVTPITRTTSRSSPHSRLMLYLSLASLDLTLICSPTAPPQMLKTDIKCYIRSNMRFHITSYIRPNIKPDTRSDIGSNIRSNIFKMRSQRSDLSRIRSFCINILIVLAPVLVPTPTLFLARDKVRCHHSSSVHMDA